MAGGRRGGEGASMPPHRVPRHAPPTTALINVEANLHRGTLNATPFGAARPGMLCAAARIRNNA